MLQQYPSLAEKPRLTVSFAQTDAEIEEAQRLRYQIFAEEMGAKIESDQKRDCDQYDPYCQHLIVRNPEGLVIGCYRLLTAASAQALGSWYSESEFNMEPLRDLLPQTIELGRACVHPDYRNGATVMMLWSGLMRFVLQQNVRYMIGCASVCLEDGGITASALYHQLSQKHGCPECYRVTPHHPLPLHPLNENIEPECPPLLKGYLRAGASICSQPAWDQDFNCADMLIMMPLEKINRRYWNHFAK
ncbi:GNAT family N-acetyltransferase [Dichelobacter nodosus]|uniref:L-ornithine N(alpha)-acyltransferase n=1 Tax=Dichelobacter nodosus (strain VCS1703A) TaxID=246195 RepID=A5EWF0_DICNV|nr:GNAT family N-acyltransferase [Dichelobacter nodosus]ABQ13380.1 conserved hypothetical protein [Dichelobacter nodosus VCS1703A]AXM45140.1 GNAT family N-acetyltransferase [Dichelobacter nodosus]KNZ39601.1 hemolysin [Dichelobacter nodosus]TGA65984.1 GNAT family N-acetyltransferase [Dichelobacter nodosus]